MTRSSSFGAKMTGSTQNASNFVSFFGEGARAATEANKDIRVDHNFVYTRTTINVFANSRDSDSAIAFRDDGVDVGLVEIGQGITGIVESGVVDVFVAADSRCNYRIDTSAGTTGTLSTTIKSHVKTGGRNRRKYNEIMLGFSLPSSSLNETAFAQMSATSTTSTTESNIQNVLDYTLHVRRLRANADVNSKNGDTVLAFRDDGTSIVSVTIGAGITGSVDSGFVSITVIAGSLTAFLMNTSASTTGSFRLSVCLVHAGCIMPNRRSDWSWQTFTYAHDSLPTNSATQFGSFFLDGNISTTESLRQSKIPYDYRLVRLRGRVSVNTKDQNTIVAFRDDGVNAATITVGAGVTGAIDSGLLSVLVVAGSLCNFNRDSSASTTGSFAVAIQAHGRAQ